MLPSTQILPANNSCLTDMGRAGAALLSLAFLLLHTFAMLVAFDGLDRRRPAQWLAVPAVHLGAALLVRGAHAYSHVLQWSSHTESPRALPVSAGIGTTLQFCPADHGPVLPRAGRVRADSQPSLPSLELCWSAGTADGMASGICCACAGAILRLCPCKATLLACVCERVAGSLGACLKSLIASARSVRQYQPLLAINGGRIAGASHTWGRLVSKRKQ